MWGWALQCLHRSGHVISHCQTQTDVLLIPRPGRVLRCPWTLGKGWTALNNVAFSMTTLQQIILRTKKNKLLNSLAIQLQGKIINTYYLLQLSIFKYEVSIRNPTCRLIIKHCRSSNYLISSSSFRNITAEWRIFLLKPLIPLCQSK